MAKRNKSILPGLVGKDTKSLSLDGIKNALNTRGSSALPVMKYFGDVKPSRNERIIKPDMTYGNEVIKQDLPTIREVLKPGFSGNFRTNYTLVEQIAATYLLDIYSGAAAAYSVFKLSSTATNCLRVRRSSDDAEQDIGFVSDTLDTASLLTFVGSNDGFVTTYYDQSGNSSNFTQTSASNQPKIVSAGVVVTSGSVPAVKFDGIGYYLSNTVDLFGEARLDQFFLTDTDGDTAYIFPNSNITSYYGMIAYSGNTSTVTTSPSYGSPSLYQNGVPINVTNRNTVYNDTNGRKVISHIAPTTSIWAEYRFGFWSPGVLNFGGKLSALVAYTSDQSANRVGIENILDSLYNP